MPSSADGPSPDAQTDQTHLDVKSAFALRGLSETSVAAATFDVVVITKAVNHQALASNADAARQPARIEVR